MPLSSGVALLRRQVDRLCGRALWGLSVFDGEQAVKAAALQYPYAWTYQFHLPWLSNSAIRRETVSRETPSICPISFPGANLPARIARKVPDVPEFLTHRSCVFNRSIQLNDVHKSLCRVEQNLLPTVPAWRTWDFTSRMRCHEKLKDQECSVAS